MGYIVILDENTSNKIAAGEVIERPASVVKELVENSIDAGASAISVEIKNGGISYIKITDNGSGIAEDDAEIAFERHATSKIRSANDLESISTLGFRGEALASIAAVSTVELTTRVKSNSHGAYVKIQGGVTKDVKQTGCPVGTTFIVKELFYNTPARFKFLKKDSTEAGYISDAINRIALGNPHISFKLISNNVLVIHTPGNNDLLSTIFSIYGKETAKEVTEINYNDNKLKISGYAGKPEIARANRNHQSIFINGRYIKSKLISSAIDEAYKTFLMKNKHAFIVLNLEVNPLVVDINVHPTKMEVRFSEEQDIFRGVYYSINNALLGKTLIRNVQFENKPADNFKFEKKEYPRIDYSQQKINVTQPKEIEAPKSVINPYNGNVDKSIPGVEIEKTIPQKSYAKSNYIKENDLVKYASNKDDTKISEIKVDNKTIEKIEEKSSTNEENNIKQITSIESQSIANIPQENVFTNGKIIGQAFLTYIILQYNDELILIDQHAAHERIMYEKLLKKYNQNENLSQVLLTPVVVELTHQEIKYIDEKKDFFEKIGFSYEDFGNNSIIIRSIPTTYGNMAVKEVFLDVIDYLMNSTVTDMNNRVQTILFKLACKSAVKANNVLDIMEIENLLKELSIIENPYTCPHGRPTAIKITKCELEKKFKRIV